ncbi:hypothetical protein [Streptomyces sp. NPDC048436]|uniref:hypothetical protein n=1 Tax=Streptomyces sp. NPDC048436 TaxID=3365550 RepID=UPI00371C61F8
MSIRTHGHDNGAQIIFHFRPGEQGEPGRIMVRVDIPSSHVSYASQYVADLQQAYGLKDSTAEAPEDESLRRVPCDSDGWLAVPESVQSAELYEEIFDRIAAVPAP